MRPDILTPVRLPTSCLVVLVGPSGSGKSHWAAEQLPARADRVLRRPAGRWSESSEHDQRAGTDAFEVLDLIVERRLSPAACSPSSTPSASTRAAGASTVDLARRARRRLPRGGVRHPRRRLPGPQPGPGPIAVPAKVLTAQLAAGDEAAADLADEGFDGVHRADRPVEIVAGRRWSAPATRPAARRRRPPALRAAAVVVRRPAARAVSADRLAEIGVRRRGRRLLQHLGHGPRGADPPGGAAVGGHARELDDAGVAGGPDPHRPARHPRHAASPCAIPPTWPRSSPPSTC